MNLENQTAAHDQGVTTQESHGGHSHQHQGHVHGPNCSHSHGPSHDPVVRAEAKVGRNDPCPCGSDLKFKKCHGK